MKKEFIALGVVILALSGYLYFRQEDRTHYRLPVLADVAAESISRMEMTGPGPAVVLKKDGGSWKVGEKGYAADGSRAKAMADAVARLTLTALVSESKNYEPYGLDDSKRILVKAWAGTDQVRTVSVGIPAASFQQTFLRLDGDDRVYHARENLRVLFDQTVDSLRDKRVLSFAPDEVTQVEIDRSGKALAFLKQPSAPQGSADSAASAGASAAPGPAVWKTSDGRNADEAKLMQLLSILSTLHCETFLEGRTRESFADPICTIRIKAAEEHRLSIFSAKEEESKPAISSSNESVFTLMKGQEDRILSPPETLLASTPADPAPQKKPAGNNSILHSK